MADKKKILKYYRKREVGVVGFRSMYPADINQAISQLQVDLGQPPKRGKDNLLFAAARIGLGLPPIDEQ